MGQTGGTLLYTAPVTGSKMFDERISGALESNPVLLHNDLQLCTRTTSERMSCGIRESSSRRRRGRLECEADQLETEHIRIKFKPRVGRRDAETQLRRVSRLVLWIEPRMVLMGRGKARTWGDAARISKQSIASVSSGKIT
jgi:hypothetical protein